MDPAASEAFRDSFRAASADITEGLSAGRDASADGYWAKWQNFCQRVALDPHLSSYEDPVPILITFAREYRVGDVAAASGPVRSKTVQDAVRSVAQTLTALGARDPRLSGAGKLDYRLQLQYRCYTRQDPPPNRVKPIPVQILRAVAAIAAATNDPELQAVSDMIILAFFFLLRPGEYTASKSDSTPFRLCDVTLSVGRTVFTSASSEADLLTATFCILIFTTQKNGVRNEKNWTGCLRGSPPVSPGCACPPGAPPQTGWSGPHHPPLEVPRCERAVEVCYTRPHHSHPQTGSETGRRRSGL